MVRPSNLKSVSLSDMMEMQVAGSDIEKFILDVVHCLDCVVGILVLAVAHKAKTTATTGIAVLDNNLKYHGQA